MYYVSVPYIILHILYRPYYIYYIIYMYNSYTITPVYRYFDVVLPVSWSSVFVNFSSPSCGAVLKVKMNKFKYAI